MIADLFKIHPGRSVKNADIILQNVHVINVNHYLLKSIFIRMKIGKNKRKEIKNIGKYLETKVITLLSNSVLFLLKFKIKFRTLDSRTSVPANS